MTLQKYFVLLIILALNINFTNAAVKIVLIVESNQLEATAWFKEALRDAEAKNEDLKIIDDMVILNRTNEDESYNKLCSVVSNGVNMIFELTWSEWETAKIMAESWDIPHIKSQAGSTIVVLEALLDLLEARNATDTVFVFQSETDLDQALYNLVGKTFLRILAIQGTISDRAAGIKAMRPTPGQFVIVGDFSFVQDSYKLAKANGLVTLTDRWILAFTDLNYVKLDTSILEESTTLLFLGQQMGCRLQEIEDTCTADSEFQMEYVAVSKLVDNVLNAYLTMDKNNQLETKVQCGEEPNKSTNYSKREKMLELLEKSTFVNNSIFFWNKEKKGIYLKGLYNVQVGNKSVLEDVAKWTSADAFNLIPGATLKPSRTFYRIGIAKMTPWTYEKIDPATGKPMLNEKGEPIYEGYCIELAEKIAQMMNFDYELVMAKQGGFGRKFVSNGTWIGLVGDLANGKTDIAVAATVMTSEREEVVDFVAPYYDQIGLSIVMRKPMRKTSLFKFMTVLKLEVWLSILAAITLTAILLSLLDRYSPYSARNNKNAYPYPCREFSLKESFWFALTSFTPQGGGEAPKALSGRTLVAAYWLFVVLMLATFTANLAAFLTVERMQTPVSSLEQLARQSRIKYTVANKQAAHKYFSNMKNAEDTLYRVWKEITLNSSSDQTIYQVWDYPIKEQYGHISLAIETANPLATAAEGFRKVNENLDADFAFIHESSEIKYEVSKNCNLTEIGEIFGERPIAIAVQQGSRIQEDVSKVILQLQRERFFEYLQSKYWNNSIRGECDDFDESEGITLESLGGVFIATLFGLALAMITLVWEIVYYKRKEKKIESFAPTTEKVKRLKGMKFLTKKSDDDFHKQNITIGGTFKPALDKIKPRVSYINVDPKLAWNP